MSVYNGADRLSSTLDSILCQKGVSLEFIVIDDGSEDDTGDLLDAYAAKDGRLRVIHQGNTGLTRALIRGCSLARGTYIARQDAGGDVSLSGRLQRQLEFLEKDQNAVMVSCGTRFIGPRGEFLYEVIQPDDQLQKGLETLDLNDFTGPSHHGSTMFRRCSFENVGGYRATFAFAQDQDLWLRMAEVGKCATIPEVFYEAHLSKGSISATRRKEQVRAMEVILDCARLRRSGRSDDPRIERFIDCPKSKWCLQSKFRSRNEARFFYFIGCMLQKREPEQARSYFEKSLRAWIFNPKAIIKLLLSIKL